MKFYEKLSKVVSEKGMTQADFARATGLSTAQTCYLFGKTENPRMVTVLMIVEALDLSLDDFLSDIEFPRD